MLEQALRNVAVVGAAGKMGSGIALLLLREMARLEVENRPTETFPEARLHLVDCDRNALKGLYRYLQIQLRRYAEKSIVSLRAAFQDRLDLVDNGEIIDAFLERALLIVHLATDMECAAESRLVFEAVFEKLEIKGRLFENLKRICPPDAFFFTNTSSIPISAIEESAGLRGRLIGYHFYNPAAVQKLLEIIPTASTPEPLNQIAVDLGKRLGKTLVQSRDIAGFIGNGFFVRDALFGIGKMEILARSFSSAEAIYMVNRVTQDFMIRPMGIFQLIDYVGLEVFQMILESMDRYIGDETFCSPAIRRMLEAGNTGGQLPDGSQRDGFLRYEKDGIAGVYNLDTKAYVEIDTEFKRKCDSRLGSLPPGHHPWKSLSKDGNREQKLAAYFGNLSQEKGRGAQMAREYLQNAGEISRNLIESGVATGSAAVATVTINGFYHLYEPDNRLF